MKTATTILSIGCLIQLLVILFHLTFWGLVIFILIKIAMYLCN